MEKKKRENQPTFVHKVDRKKKKKNYIANGEYLIQKMMVYFEIDLSFLLILFHLNVIFIFHIYA